MSGSVLLLLLSILRLALIGAGNQPAGCSRRQQAAGSRQEAACRRYQAGGSKQKGAGRREQAEGSTQEVPGRRQEAGGRRREQADRNGHFEKCKESEGKRYPPMAVPLTVWSWQRCGF